MSPEKSAEELSIHQLVEYEQHGKPYLALVLRGDRGKYRIMNEVGEELELHRDRLLSFDIVCPEKGSTKESRVAFIETFRKEAQACFEQVDLQTLYDLVVEENEYTVENLTEIMFSGTGAKEQFALRRALLENRLFFKRTKFGYEKRSLDKIEELRRQEAVVAEKNERKRELVESCLARLRGEDRVLPGEISRLEQVAANGNQGADGKENLLLLDEILKDSKLSLAGKPEEKAFELLVRLRHFSRVEDLNLYRLSRPIRFSQRILDACEELLSERKDSLHGREDLRHLHCVTIDSDSTKDIDDALSVEEIDGGFRLGIHISDVASTIPVDSALDKDALRRATSVYAPDYQLSMLPKIFSECALSLIKDQDRPVVSYLIDLNAECEVVRERIVKGTINVAERLNYDVVDSILYENISGHPEERLINLLWKIASSYEIRRIERGALHFSRRELNASIDENGKITIDETDEETPGRKLVGELMIAANELSARVAAEKNVPLIFRGQDPPHEGKGIDKIPEGPAREFALRGLLQRSVLTSRARPHSSLGVSAYAQVTSPIRRASDLVNQRQLLGVLDGAAPYSEEEVREKIESIERVVDEVNGLQRSRNRFWLMSYLKQEAIAELEGTIVRVDGARPLVELDIVRLLSPFNSDKKTAGDASRLGERIKLKITKNDPRNEFLQLNEIR